VFLFITSSKALKIYSSEISVKSNFALWDNLFMCLSVLNKRNSSEEFSNLIQSAKNELSDIKRNSDNQLFIKDKERYAAWFHSSEVFQS